MPSHPPPPQLNPTRFKTALKVSISKLKFIQDKKTAITKQQRRLLADLLKQGKESSAKIRIENIIRDDIYIELLEYLELYCELVLARSSIILDPARTTCDQNVIEAVQSLIYSAPHSELKEMTQIRDFLVFKYGAEFGKAAAENSSGIVPKKISSRCLVDPPSEELVNLYLCEVAKAYDAPFSGLKDLEVEVEETNEDDEDDDESPSGGIGVEAVLEQPIAETTDEPVKPKVTKPVSQAKKTQDEFDVLKARFAALKGTP